jgi:ActR/RegA family two-component response regulator
MRVLIVEDEAPVVRALKRLLLRHDVEIDFAMTFEQGHAGFRRNPELVLLDLRLGADPENRGGLELLSHARAYGYAGFVVIHTGVADFASARRAVGQADEFLEKGALTQPLVASLVRRAQERSNATISDAAQRVARLPGHPKAHLAELERCFYEEAYRLHDKNVARTARELGIDRKTLRERLGRGRGARVGPPAFVRK